MPCQKRERKVKRSWIKRKSEAECEPTALNRHCRKDEEYLALHLAQELLQIGCMKISRTKTNLTFISSFAVSEGDLEGFFSH